MRSVPAGALSHICGAPDSNDEMGILAIHPPAVFRFTNHLFSLGKLHG